MTIGPDRWTRMRWGFSAGPMFNSDQNSGGGKDDNDGDPPGNEGTSDSDTDDDDGGEDESGKGKDDDFEPITSKDQFEEAVNRILSKRLSRERSKIRREVEQDVERDARQKEAKEQGDYKTLYEEQSAELQKLKDDIAESKRADLKRRIAKEEGLPEDVADRLAGDDEDALRADAKKLAAHFKNPDPPETDGGRSVTGGSTGRKRAGGSDEIDYDDPEAWLSGL